MKTSKISLCLAITFLSLKSFSEPRKDLYKQIKQETGVSLKEAFEGVQGKNQFAVDMLKSYYKKVGIKDIEKSFQEEIDHRALYCKKKKSISCDETVSDLKDQVSLIKDLSGKYESLAGIKKLYLNLLVYQFNIKIKVLKNDLEDWQKNCSSQDKINTKPCQEKLFEAHVFADVARDLSQVALYKSENQSADQDLLNDIKNRISRYENF